jgi:hypothetical protein
VRTSGLAAAGQTVRGKRHQTNVQECQHKTLATNKMKRPTLATRSYKKHHTHGERGVVNEEKKIDICGGKTGASDVHLAGAPMSLRSSCSTIRSHDTSRWPDISGISSLVGIHPSGSDSSDKRRWVNVSASTCSEEIVRVSLRWKKCQRLRNHVRCSDGVYAQNVLVMATYAQINKNRTNPHRQAKKKLQKNAREVTLTSLK